MSNVCVQGLMCECGSELAVRFVLLDHVWGCMKIQIWCVVRNLIVNYKIANGFFGICDMNINLWKLAIEAKIFYESKMCVCVHAKVWAWGLHVKVWDSPTNRTFTFSVIYTRDSHELYNESINKQNASLCVWAARSQDFAVLNLCCW